MDNNVLSYVIWQDIDLAEAVTAKGSALAQADVIEGIRVPANTAVVDVWAQKVGAFTGTSTDLTFDIGITGGDVDKWVDGWDFDGAALNSFATPVGVGQSITLATSDTIDILFITQTGTVTGGKVRLFASCVDLNVKGRGEIAQPKS
jgi:hypothetical protein